jgi:hypothetical protein
VPYDVGERFLCDPVRGRLHGARGETATEPVVKGHAQAETRALRGQRREIRELRLRREGRGARRGFVAPQEREHAAHFIEAGRAECPDIGERFARAFGLPVEQVKAHAGLDSDLAERMREHIVQLPGDARALVLFGSAAALLQLSPPRGTAVDAPPNALTDREAGGEEEGGDRDPERVGAGSERAERHDRDDPG